MFVGILLMVAGVLNIVYGIAAVGNAKFFVNDTQFVFSSLHTWGWITIILGVIQLTASFSLFAGGVYGRVIGLVAATIGAVGALLDVARARTHGGRSASSPSAWSASTASSSSASPRTFERGDAGARARLGLPAARAACAST